MGLPRIATLVAVAGCGGVITGCMAMLMTKQRDKLTNQASFIQAAVDLLEQQPVTKEILGEQLKVGKATIGDGWSKLSKFDVQVRVPIRGELDSAYLYAYARRTDEREKLRLYKLEATFGKVADKKLVLLDRTNDQEESGGRVAKGTSEGEAKPAAAADEKKRPDEGLSPWEKKSLYVEQMKGWQPQR